MKKRVYIVLSLGVLSSMVLAQRVALPANTGRGAILNPITIEPEAPTEPTVLVPADRPIFLPEPRSPYIPAPRPPR
jgi:hypothetical protein